MSALEQVLAPPQEDQGEEQGLRVVFADVDQQLLEDGDVLLVLAVVVVQPGDDLRDELDEPL